MTSIKRYFLDFLGLFISPQRFAGKASLGALQDAPRGYRAGKQISHNLAWKFFFRTSGDLLSIAFIA